MALRFLRRLVLSGSASANGAEFIARRRGQRQLRFGGEVLRAIGAARAGRAIGIDDLALPVALLVDLPGGAGDVGELLARLDGVGHRRRDR